MAERKAVNRYYPPDFDPAKHKSINKYVGQHPLRERAKKIKQGILVIRFEMPYNIWCGGCNIHIGMGVRYNAEKSKVGMYFSTPIYKFRMKCHLCDNYFEIQTDPKNCDYVILSGARRKEQRWDAAQNEQIVTDDRDKIKKLATDPMFKLEHQSDGKQKIKKVIPGLGEIEALQIPKKDDYILNKLARRKFRGEKKQLKQVELLDRALLKKSSLDIQLVKEHSDDVRLAHLLKFKSSGSYEDKQIQIRSDINSRPLFQSGDRNDATNPIPSPKQKLIESIHAQKSQGFSNQDSTPKSLSMESIGIKRKRNIAQDISWREGSEAQPSNLTKPGDELDVKNTSSFERHFSCQTGAEQPVLISDVQSESHSFDLKEQYSHNELAPDTGGQVGNCGKKSPLSNDECLSPKGCATSSSSNVQQMDKKCDSEIFCDKPVEPNYYLGSPDNANSGSGGFSALSLLMQDYSDSNSD